eukprot:3884204-Alexandrium_andersonii.AAC.1
MTSDMCAAMNCVLARGDAAGSQRPATTLSTLQTTAPWPSALSLRPRSKRRRPGGRGSRAAEQR